MTVVVVDATRLERNLNLVLQVLEITDRVVVCLNLMDEAKRHGLEVDARRLARDLGVPVVPTSARFGEGLPELLQAIARRGARRGQRRPAPARRTTRRRCSGRSRAWPTASTRCVPGLPNARWVALRLLDGDERIQRRSARGELRRPAGERRPTDASRPAVVAPPAEQVEALLAAAPPNCGGRSAADFHQSLMEAIYTEAARIADRAVSRPGTGSAFDLDRTIDRLVTSRVWGFPLMIAMLTAGLLAHDHRRERAVGHAGRRC